LSFGSFPTMSKINEEGLPRSEPWFLPFNKDAKVLCVYIALFFLISVAQFVASLPPFANSLALRADCVSMAVGPHPKPKPKPNPKP